MGKIQKWGCEMGRKPRVEYIGAMYHIIQRGNNRAYIFEEEEDKVFFLELVGRYKEEMEYEVLAFVIMDNHYHMIIRTMKDPIHTVMRRINTQYSKYFNRKNDRSGHAFQNRYKGIVVEDDRYLLSLLKYIHLNPVKAKIAKKMQFYRFSSDRFYRGYNSDIVDIDFVLSIFYSDSKKNPSRAIKLYSKFMDDEEDEEYKEFLENLENKEDIKRKKEKKEIRELLELSSKKRKSLQEILENISEGEENFNLIKNGSRKRSLTRYKIRYIKEAIEERYTLKEIGNYISVSDVAILDMFNRLKEEEI